jgi:uncharacterized protein (TIGR03437 family)
MRWTYYLLGILGLLSFPHLNSAANTPRTITDKEIGMVYQYPVTQPGTGLTWGATGYYAVGANVSGPMTTTSFDPTLPNSIGADALKMYHTIFQQWGAIEDHVGAFTLYDELQAYEADEVAAGRSPLFVTSGGQPVYFNSSATYYLQALNVCDPRYVRFFANEFARKTLLSPSQPGLAVSPQYPNAWVSLDDGTFLYADYSLTLNGPQPAWDSIFPRSQGDWNTCIEGFFSELARIAPDVRLMQNEGSLYESDGSDGNHDLNLFQAIYSNIAGMFREDAWALPTSTRDGSDRDDWYNIIRDVQSFLQQGKPVLLRFPSDGSAGQIESAAIGYLLVRDGNSFFSESTNDPANEVDPDSPVFSYSRMFDKLGNPTGQLQITSYNSFDYGYNLYSRTYEGGIVYLNWSGATQTIALTSGTWYDQNGNLVTSLTIPDISSSADAVAGIYVTNQNGPRVAKPTISPLNGAVVTGPVTVTLADATPGAVVHYTVDSSTPNCSSTTYAGPFQITATTTITAIACNASYGLQSWEDQTTLSLTSTKPAANFALTTDSATPFFTTTYAAVTLSNPSASAVTVRYAVSGDSGITFSPAGGSITFQPFETAKALPIQVSLVVNAPRAITATLTGASGASIGSSNKYLYTVAPNTPVSATKWINLHPVANAEGDSSNPTTNYGRDSTLYTGHDLSDQNLRSLWQFDLSLIPSNAVVTSAKLLGYLPTNQDTNDSGIPVSVYRMTSPWTQNRTTWNETAGNPANWAATATATANAHSTGSGDPLANHWDLTADVKAMLSGNVPNYGWIMIGPEEAAEIEDYAWYTNNLIVPDLQPSLYVTYTVQTGSPGTALPVVTSVRNAASFNATAISPGELVTIFGQNMGPTAGLGAQVAAGQVSTNIGGVEVLFDNVPAPLLYVSATQVNAVVPYEVTGQQTSLAVSYQGVQSAPVVLNTALAAPGLFAANSDGTGQGVIYNADGSQNNTRNPAAAGSVIVLYGTGEGILNPPGVTGRIAEGVHTKIAGTVSVRIGNSNAATIQYAGAVPGTVEGIFQINVVIPSNVPAGNQPVLVTIDGVPSQAAATVAIK